MSGGVHPAPRRLGDFGMQNAEFGMRKQGKSIAECGMKKQRKLITDGGINNRKNVTL
jgi:hypothetical protein